MTEFKSATGGTVRIMMDCMPKTPQERERREQALWKACCEVLANAAATYGVDETIRRMHSGPHAALIGGRGAEHA